MNVVEHELRKLHKEASDGLLKPKDVVESAKSKESPLHEHFEWDDGKAGHQYRLQQARNLIVRYEIVIDKHVFSSRVSLLKDRATPGGGYRQIEDVLTNEDLKKELLLTATKDFESWKKRYESILYLVIERVDELEGALRAEYSETGEA